MLKRETLKEKISERVLDWIKTNNLVSGDRLLSEKNIAKLFGVNHLTVRAAFTTLEKDGYIERRPRSGTYVKRLPDVVDPTKNSDSSNLVTVLMRNSGHTHADLVDCLCRKLQTEGYVPLVVPLPLDHDYGPMLEHIRKTWEMGSNKLIVGCDFYLWLEPISSQLGLLRDNPGWEKIIWMDSSPLPQYIAGGSVALDVKSSALKVINHLKSLGCEKISFLTNQLDPAHPFPEHNRAGVAAYESAMIANGLAKQINIIFQGGSTQENFDQIKSILKKKNRPQAIFAVADFRLISVCKAANELGIGIPNDLALVGYLDTPWATEYSLTSVSSEIFPLTNEVLGMLDESENACEKRPSIKIQSTLVIRNSTKPQKRIQYNRIPEFAYAT